MYLHRHLCGEYNLLEFMNGTTLHCVHYKKLCKWYSAFNLHVHVYLSSCSLIIMLFVFLLYRENLIVQFLLNRKLLSCLPNDHIRLGQTIRIVPVLFVYGVTESPQGEPLWVLCVCMYVCVTSKLLLLMGFSSSC